MMAARLVTKAAATNTCSSLIVDSLSRPMIVKGISMNANRYCRQTTSARMGTPLIRLLAIRAAMKMANAAIQ